MLKKIKWWLEELSPILLILVMLAFSLWMVVTAESHKGDDSFEAVADAQFVLYDDDGKMYALPDHGVVVDMDEGVQYIYLDGQIVSPRYKCDGTLYTVTE